MDGRSRSSDPEDPRIDPESDGICPPSTADLKSSTRLPSCTHPKRSRRSVRKRVVSVPNGEGAAPPSDSWAWRKYGQKPIKGSPYPRGYYRCSSYRGCPARKQVERSRVDPTMLVITYSVEHNHSGSLPKNHHQSFELRPVEAQTPDPEPDSEPAAAESVPPGPADPDEKFADLIADESSSRITPDELYWFSDVGSTSPPETDDALLYGPICVAGATAGIAMMFADECERLAGHGGGGEEDSMFADLGELPECSAVFRRGFVEMHMGGEGSRRSTLTAAPWCGSTG